MSGTSPLGGAACIALIHATRLAVQPIEDAFARHWPEAERLNLLDDSLPAARTRTPGPDDRLRERFVALSRYAELAGADGILYTCSAFGPEIEAARLAVTLPTLKPNEAMFDAALEIGTRVGLLATFPPSIAPMQQELVGTARLRSLEIDVQVGLATGAFEALQRGDGELHDELVLGAARRFSGIDVLLLAQFSMARAAQRLGSRIDVPVLSSPDSAVRLLRRQVESRKRAP